MFIKMKLEERVECGEKCIHNQAITEMIEQDWYPVEEGRTVGTTGSERGVILQDEEYVRGGRITLEQCRYPPFAITCGVYGWMVHTTFASSLGEAKETYVAMKKRLEEICRLVPSLDDVNVEEKCDHVVNVLEAFVRDF
ncbi:hypothetical protein KSF_050070 [Reticulibacter mediterranei]|uniref:Uncharacterized protein n=1 Tax=Reticulibacter mediterranei TaxID=2778369 RepID=A0A8J3N193_9CHLR|nr:hypothetical protein KSF_050070 [Reticulibacter mediterranei]